jgi:lipopolysaccharide assembly outer membrane protein LptD (OstA)
VVRLNGNVRIESEVCLPVGKDRAVVCDGYTIVTADSAVYHEDTGQLEAHGAVSISPLLHGEMKQRP